MRPTLAPARLAGTLLLASGFACLGLGGGPAGASPRLGTGPRIGSSVSVNFTAAAAAPVVQITEDEPTAQFHPEGEGEYGYTYVTANPAAATALAAVVWPGAAAGNAGTLVSLLGGPDSLSALNDPVQASATTGTSQTHSSITTPAGTAMTASVEPASPSDVHSAASSSLAGGGLGGAGSVGSSTSTSGIDFASSTSNLTLTAQSKVTDVDLNGVVKVASVTSSATAQSIQGGTPKLVGATSFHDMTIGGQQVYVDGSGVHVGAPGAPAGPAGVDAVDAALAAAGMEVYFTAPHTITVGGTAYYYAASVLFYWAPPNDPSHNSFTMSLGGAAVSLTNSSMADGFGDLSGNAIGLDSGPSTGGGPAGAGLGSTTSPGTSTAGSAAVPPATAPPVAAPAGATGLPGPAAAPAGGATLSLPASPSAAASSAGGRGGAALDVATRLPGGIGVGWVVLAAIAALAGAGLTTRVPALLTRQAAGACPRARNPRSRSGREPRSHFGREPRSPFGREKERP